MNNRAFERFVINYYGNLPKILKDLDVHVQPNGLFLCPMHDNYDTPAAKLFKDDNGWAFYCFAEQRQFGTYDVYKEYYHQNMKTLFRKIWSNLTPAQQAKMKDLFGDVNDERVLANENIYQAFFNRQINYQQMLKLLKNEICD